MKRNDVELFIVLFSMGLAIIVMAWYGGEFINNLGGSNTAYVLGFLNVMLAMLSLIDNSYTKAVSVFGVFLTVGAITKFFIQGGSALIVIVMGFSLCYFTLKTVIEGLLIIEKPTPTLKAPKTERQNKHPNQREKSVRTFESQQLTNTQIKRILETAKRRYERKSD